MARHAQPRQVAELKGSIKQNPQRYKKQTPESAHALGGVPDHLPDDAKGVWFEIETYGLQGVMTGADRFVMELTSILMAEFRRNPTEFAVGKYSQLIGCLARLGLTPADRQKLGTDKTKDDNPFDEF